MRVAYVGLESPLQKLFYALEIDIRHGTKFGDVPYDLMFEVMRPDGSLFPKIQL